MKVVILKLKMESRKRLIESDEFPFEFLSDIAQRESWRKEIYRPVNYIHKWWAKRLGSVFRGILLACALPEDKNLLDEFYKKHSFSSITIFDPFMGSGTTIGEAHKLGFTAIGRDINPVAVEATRVALGPMHRRKIEEYYKKLQDKIYELIRGMYISTDTKGVLCEVLYYFWVMQAPCDNCGEKVDLFPSWIISRNAYPNRRPEIQILCPSCGNIFQGINGANSVTCDCGYEFSPSVGNASRSKATCMKCNHTFKILDAMDGLRKPDYRLYGKLVLKANGEKEYLPTNSFDEKLYQDCSKQLETELENGNIKLPELSLSEGYNTNQSMNYGFLKWKDLFNDRQLLALSLLHKSILEINDESVRDVLLTLFSGALEFNNMFTSYKGEGTGAVRHMFSHHVLKPEKIPIEANVWGTPKSSGGFSNLFRSRLLRAIEYREKPTEVPRYKGENPVLASPPYTGHVENIWSVESTSIPRAIILSCGDSSKTDLLDESVDMVVTDPPFFDNVHYSELADFFYAWQQLDYKNSGNNQSTRSKLEVQDADSDRFTTKLGAVFWECHRILKNEGLLCFTYHHSKEDGWGSLAKALNLANFRVVNAHPVKSEMSVAIPKSQAKSPIQLDIVIVCRKAETLNESEFPSFEDVMHSVRNKLLRLEQANLNLSFNDYKMVIYGQLLTLAEAIKENELSELVEKAIKILFDSSLPQTFGDEKYKTKGM